MQLKNPSRKLFSQLTSYYGGMWSKLNAPFSAGLEAVVCFAALAASSPVSLGKETPRKLSCQVRGSDLT